MTLMRIVSTEVMPQKMTIISQIDAYARSIGLVKKEGCYTKDGRFYGSMFDVGREGGIEMQEWK